MWIGKCIIKHDSLAKQCNSQIWWTRKEQNQIESLIHLILDSWNTQFKMFECIGHNYHSWNTQLKMFECIGLNYHSWNTQFKMLKYVGHNYQSNYVRIY